MWYSRDVGCQNNGGKDKRNNGSQIIWRKCLVCLKTKLKSKPSELRYKNWDISDADALCFLLMKHYLNKAFQGI